MNCKICHKRNKGVYCSKECKQTDFNNKQIERFKGRKVIKK